MKIKNLKINNLRNVKSADIDPHPTLSLFYGDNGAGKTSILEALVVLAKGRSFRPGPVSSLLGPAGDIFRVTAIAKRESSGPTVLGLERSKTEWRARVGGKDARHLSDLAEHLPLVLMEPNSHLLVSGPPDNRRRHLDWSVFHVEHNFLMIWRRYTRALRQRNAALREQDRAVAQSLDPQLVEMGEGIDTLRQSQVRRLDESLPLILERLAPGLPPIEVRYHPGWAGGSLAEALKKSAQRDLERRNTGPGPHRADLSLLCRSQPVRETLSRGEQKVVAAAMLLAQADGLARAGKPPVLLLDDLASEFDQQHRANVLSAGLEFGAQTWVTGTDVDPVLAAAGQERSVFHVEHGRVSPSPIA
jgi:DNA replication and repair protein RecF